MKQSTKILLHGTPNDVDLVAVREKLEQWPEVKSAHHLHVWTLEGTYSVLTLHDVLSKSMPLQETGGIKGQIKTAMAAINVQHVTVEFETPEEEWKHQA